ncbi:MAG: tetratricopeptide repeat protein [Acidobacteria bacterium]|nr:tetratricopeptide repeat protein [Acidobacteriota bacterium]
MSLLSLAVPLRAEVLRGELVSDGEVRFQDLILDVVTSNHLPAARVQLNQDGRFEVRNLEPGTYFVRVTTLRGELIREESVHVSGNNIPLQIRVPATQRNVPGGRISLRRLMHKPSKNAQRSWEQSAKLYVKGDHAAALERLEQTVALDPEYFEAQALLGDERLRAGQLSEAVAAYERALEIDPSAVGVLVNRGFALLNARRVTDAQASAEKALQMDGSSLPAHLILGLTLAQQGKAPEQAEQHLKIAAEKFPQAKRALEWLATDRARRP